MTPAAVWLRVSTDGQHTENQAGLRAWAERRGLDVVRVFELHDSAWQTGNGKGRVFDAQRRELLAGARRGEYAVVLIWALDRLTRRGAEDALRYVRQLSESGCQVWSDQEAWLEDLRSPAMRELFLMLTGWMGEFESARRSERIRAGLARRAAEGKPIGRAPGAKDRKKRRTDGYRARYASQ